MIDDWVGDRHGGAMLQLSPLRAWIVFRLNPNRKYSDTKLFPHEVNIASFNRTEDLTVASRIWKAKTILNRREMMRTAGVLAAGFSFGHQRRAIAAPRAQILSKSVISMQPHLYHGWPTMTRRSNGELLIVYSGGREAHVCPFGRVEMMRSKDQGQSWIFPRVLLDSPIDDRDSGVVETAKGTLLVTTFTSLAYTSRLDKAQSFKPNQDLTWSQEKLRRWRAVDDHLTPADREKLLGSWMIRSTDGGNCGQHPIAAPPIRHMDQFSSLTVDCCMSARELGTAKKAAGPWYRCL